jgi:peptidoglycan/LPS O-acetylase OafA/YrhL
MNRATSLYIDLARFSAALVVFLGHISGQRLTGGFLWQIAPYMSHAVTIFFVLSGFVIAYATDKRENTAFSYAVSRAARIYSVVLPALAATVLLDTLGRYLQPALYSDAWGYVDHNQLASFALSALFLNEIWFIHVSPGSDLPYWSLGYEIWYYVIFGIFLFSPRKWFFLPVALTVIGPKIVSMLPLWLFGVASYRMCKRWKDRRWHGLALWSLSLSLWIAYEIWAHRYGRWLDPRFAPLRRTELPQDYLVGFLFAMNLIGFHAASDFFAPLLHPFGKPIHWIAGATFTLYLFHLPIAQFLTTILPWPPSTTAGRLVEIGGTLVLVFVIAAFTERRKDAWRRGIAWLLGRLSMAIWPARASASSLQSD